MPDKIPSSYKKICFEKYQQFLRFPESQQFLNVTIYLLTNDSTPIGRFLIPGKKSGTMHYKKVGTFDKEKQLLYVLQCPYFKKTV